MLLEKKKREEEKKKTALYYNKKFDSRDLNNIPSLEIVHIFYLESTYLRKANVDVASSVIPPAPASNLSSPSCNIKMLKTLRGAYYTILSLVLVCGASLFMNFVLFSNEICRDSIFTSRSVLHIGEGGEELDIHTEASSGIKSDITLNKNNDIDNWSFESDTKTSNNV